MSTPVGDQVLAQQWYRHSVTELEALQPVSAQAMLAASGWFPLSDKEVAAKEDAAEADRAAAEQRMTEAAAEGAVSDPADDPDPAAAGGAKTASKTGKTDTKGSE